MPPRRDKSHVARLRDTVAARVRSLSLRAVAREIGMSAPGLQSFLEGRSPYPATRRKLEAWYVRESANVGIDTSLSTARAALEILVRDLPEDLQDESVVRSIELFEAAYDRAGIPRPLWLQQLRDSLE
jgi:transcriptional regulator with XRE-family HTH domain